MCLSNETFVVRQYEISVVERTEHRPRSNSRESEQTFSRVCGETEGEEKRKRRRINSGEKEGAKRGSACPPPRPRNLSRTHSHKHTHTHTHTLTHRYSQHRVLPHWPPLSRHSRVNTTYCWQFVKRLANKRIRETDREPHSDSVIGSNFCLLTIRREGSSPAQEGSTLLVPTRAFKSISPIRL